MPELTSLCLIGSRFTLRFFLFPVQLWITKLAQFISLLWTNCVWNNVLQRFFVLQGVMMYADYNVVCRLSNNWSIRCMMLSLFSKFLWSFHVPHLQFIFSTATMTPPPFKEISKWISEMLKMINKKIFFKIIKNSIIKNNISFKILNWILRRVSTSYIK